jgi:hypothetical protein
LPADVDAEKKEKLMATGEYDNWMITDSPFLYLTAELPPPPLFKDEIHENIIPQINLVSFSGSSFELPTREVLLKGKAQYS